MCAHPLMACQQLKFSWNPERLVLDIPELTVAAHEKLFLYGPSGSGKTSLLSLLGGITVPDEGEIQLRSTVLNRMSAVERDEFRANHIGFIFQQFNLIPYLTVLENVLLPLQFAPVRRERIDDEPSLAAKNLLHHLGLSDEAIHSRNVTELSIGQQQRVAAARAMIGSPDIIIADEPTSALDYDARTAFIDLLFNQTKLAGSAVVFVSHDRTLESLFDRSISLLELNRTGANA